MVLPGLASETDMAKLTFGAHPFLLGFEQIDRVLEQSVRNRNEGYPPYNIEQIGPNAIRITVAVAGFGEEDISVTEEDRQLVIRGKQVPDDRERLFLHRGIAARQFQRSFVLAEGLEVRDATLTRGLLHVDLVRDAETPRVRKVTINRV